MHTEQRGETCSRQVTGIGATQPLTVTGTYSDASTAQILSGVTFSSSNTAVASVSAAGLVTSVTPGTATINAALASLVPAQAFVTVNPAAACVMAPSGLVSWWPGNGDANDALGQNNPLAVNAVGFVAGKVGQGFAFGLAGYIDIPASPSLANQRFAVEAWVRPDGAGPNNDEFGNMIVGQNVDDFHTSVQLLWRATDSRFLFIFGDISSERIVSQHQFLPGQFYYITASYDGSNFTLFVNGQPEGSLALTKTITYPNTPWSVGSLSASFRAKAFARTWNGVIDEVSVYNRALSLAEIQAVFNAGDAGKCPQVIGPQLTEADAVAFSVLNLAAVTGGQPLNIEADGRPFSVLNAAGGAPNQPTSKEADATAFSVLNLASMTGGQPVRAEANASDFSVLNTAVTTPSGQPVPMEADGRVVATVNLAGGFGAPALRACYDPSLGTLPQAQGWTYSGNGTNPAPFVVGGVLHETTTAGGQAWSIVDTSVDFSQHVILEARLRVNSSNYVPNVGTGTREGYYFFLTNTNTGVAHSIGLADAGFNIDSITVPNQLLMPFAIADGNFHVYRFEILNGFASFSIDGTLVGSGFQPFFNGVGSNVAFGALAGASRSDTDLAYVCYSTTPK